MRLTTFLTTFLVTGSGAAGGGAEASGASGGATSRLGGAPLPLEEITRFGVGDAFSAVTG
jgi:hypothetical protein